MPAPENTAVPEKGLRKSRRLGATRDVTNLGGDLGGAVSDLFE